MPTIKLIDGTKISINHNDHNPPHVHVDHREYNGRINIIDDSLLTGSKLPPKVLARAHEYINEHRELLLSNWKKLNPGLRDENS